MSTIGNGFALNKAEGKVMGVCAGLGDWIGVNPLWVRVFVVALAIVGHFFVLPLYLAIGLLAPKRLPVIGDEREVEERLFRRAARRDDRGDIADLDARVSAMERQVRGQARFD